MQKFDILSNNGWIIEIYNWSIRSVPNACIDNQNIVDSSGREFRLTLELQSRNIYTKRITKF